LPQASRDLAQRALCPARDVHSSTAIDPTVSCDSLSIGLGFSGYEIGERGDFFDVPSFDDLCPLTPDGGPNPAQDWDCP
jgi:hypothetical protein